MKTVYTIPAPDSLGAQIEVYGEPENAWYEWRIIDGGRTVRDTGTEGHSAFQGRQYGTAGISDTPAGCCCRLNYRRQASRTAEKGARVMTQQRIKPAYAKFDPAHVFDGLFVPTKGKKRGRLYVPPRRFGDSEISFQGFEQLGADDQSILLAVSAQLGIDGLMIEAKPPGEIGQQLRLALDFDNDDGRPLKTKGALP